MQGLRGTSFTVTKTFNRILRIDEKHNCDFCASTAEQFPPNVW